MLKRLHKKQRRHKFPWVRLLISVVVIALIVVALLFNIQGATIFVVLGIVLTLFQWLFPLSTENHGSSTTLYFTPPDSSPQKSETLKLATFISSIF